MDDIKYLAQKLELYVMEYDQCPESARENLPYSIKDICMELINEVSKVAMARN